MGAKEVVACGGGMHGLTPVKLQPNNINISTGCVVRGFCLKLDCVFGPVHVQRHVYPSYYYTDLAPGFGAMTCSSKSNLDPSIV